MNLNLVQYPNNNNNGKGNDVEMMDVVNEINETNEMIVEWNQVEISNKPNNDSIKLFTVEVKDIVTTEGSYYLVHMVFYILTKFFIINFRNYDVG
ncbi:13386_t:CDS:2 [Entrophospora sp. SA101]|nr:13386_t:CDS:2 [Entrophospora sp. SA101]